MPKRKIEKNEPEESNGSEEENTSSENEKELNLEPDENESDIEVEFSFDDFKEINFKSIRNLLKKYIPGTQINYSEMADSIVNQIIVGTAITVDDSGDVYGFATVLNIKHQLNISYMKDIINIIVEACPSDLLNDFKSKINSKNTGLLINERLINVPDELVPHLHKNLYDDIEYAKKNGIEDEPARFTINDIIIISPCYYYPQTTGKKPKKSKIVHDVSNAQFYHFEDTIYQKYSKSSFLFHVTLTEEYENDPNYRCVMVISYKDIPKILDELKTIQYDFL